MRIEWLREYLTLAKRLSFSQTANEHFTDGSSVSRHLAALEKEIGPDTKLMVRTRQGSFLTEEGKLAFEGFQKVVDMYDLTCEIIQSSQKAVSGTVRLGVLYMLADSYLRTILERVRTLYPDLMVEVSFYAGLNDLREALLSRDIDLALACTDVTLDEGIHFHAFATDEIVCVYSTADALVSIGAEKGALDLDDIRGRAILATPHTKQLFSYHRVLEEEGLEVTLLDDVWSFALLPSVIHEAGAVTFIPAHIAKLGFGTTNMSPVADSRFKAAVALLYTRDTPAIDAILDIVDSLGDVPR